MALESVAPRSMAAPGRASQRCSGQSQIAGERLRRPKDLVSVRSKARKLRYATDRQRSEMDIAEVLPGDSRREPGLADRLIVRLTRTSPDGNFQGRAPTQADPASSIVQVAAQAQCRGYHPVELCSLIAALVPTRPTFRSCMQKDFLLMRQGPTNQFGPDKLSPRGES